MATAGAERLAAGRRVKFQSPGVDRCFLLARPPRCRPAAPGPQRRGLAARAARDAYEVLGVDRQATRDDLKRAFKRKALKLHPDVNSAPDAAAQFAECKQAYETLANEDTRRSYDRKAQGGAWDVGEMFSGAANWGRQRPGQPEEPWYGFGDFFRDLERDAAQRRGGGPPKSLWEELNDLGGEFVEFLEQGLEERTKGAPGQGPAERGRGQGGQARGEREAPPPRGPSPEELAAKARKDAADAAKRASDDIEDMLSQMKRDLKL